MLSEDLYRLALMYIRCLKRLGLKLWKDIGRKLPLNVKSYDIMKLVLDEVNYMFHVKPIETAVIISNSVYD